MVEKGVKILWALSSLLLLLTYLIGWFQNPLGPMVFGMAPLQLHFLTAIPVTLFHFFTALGVLFYFIGSGVWIKDKAYSYVQTDRPRAQALFEIYKQANKLKGRAFPFVTFSIFFGIMTFVLGGAIQVAAIPYWLHPAVATCSLLVALASFPFIFPAIDRNIFFLDQASQLSELD